MKEEDYPVSIVCAGGGTAGHVNPLLSIADSIRQKNPRAHISVIGTQEGLESQLVPQSGYPLEIIEKIPFPRRINKKALQFPFKWRKETRHIEQYLKEVHADAIVGVGGYVAAPVYAAAHRMRIPIIIHEQNARAGIANKLGARWATFIGAAYPHTGLHTAAGTPAQVVGLPLRPVISQAITALATHQQEARQMAIRACGLNPSLPILLVTGGSLGALHINDVVSKAAALLIENGIQVIHLTGKNKDKSVYETVRASIPSAVHPLHLENFDYSKILHQSLMEGGSQISSVEERSTSTASSQAGYYIAPYLEAMDKAFVAADLIIGRSGAGTVNEISALGIPAVYIPLAIGNGEQRLNALPSAQKGGALIISEKNFTPHSIKEIIDLIKDKEKLEHMRHAAYNSGLRHAAEIMGDCALEIAQNYYLSRRA